MTEPQSAPMAVNPVNAFHVVFCSVYLCCYMYFCLWRVNTPPYLLTCVWFSCCPSRPVRKQTGAYTPLLTRRERCARHTFLQHPSPLNRKMTKSPDIVIWILAAAEPLGADPSSLRNCPTWRHGTARHSRPGLGSCWISATSLFREEHRCQC